MEAPSEGRDTIELRYYDRIFEGLPAIDSRIDLSSTRRVFGQTGSRTLRTPVPGAAVDLENIRDEGQGSDRLVGNGRANQIWLPEGHSTVDCRGGRDTVVGPSDARTKNCEVVKPFGS